MVKFSILAGGNLLPIVSLLFDSDNKSLLTQGNSLGRYNSWIDKRPNTPVLYAVTGDSIVQSFTIFENGTLSGVSSTKSHGGRPAHILALETGEVSVMNLGGNGAIIPTSRDNRTNFEDGITTVIEFPFNGSRPQQTIEYKDELLVSDEGANIFWRLTRNDTKTFSVGGRIIPGGTGRYRVAIINDILVTLNEITNNVTSQTIPSISANESSIISTLSIIPPGQTGTFVAGEVLVPSTNYDFPDTFVYASNRDFGNPKGDAIAIFSLTSKGEMQLVGHFFTELEQIQGMQFVGENNKYLVAGGVGGVAVFERIEKGSNLTTIATNNDILNRRSFAWA